jgi:cytochrome c-type biogenesis protein CcmH/NrfG
MRTKVAIAVMLVALAFYAVLVGAKGVAMIGSGSAAGIALGVGVVILPVVGSLLVWRELQFGQQSARLAAVLEAEGGLPLDDLPRRPSGRVDRAAADSVFTARKADAEADPDNWRTWYRLGLAYDDAGDRARARAAVRRAIGLVSSHGT